MTNSDTYLAVLDELRELTLKKRRGYSPGDDPFKNFRMSETFGVNPLRGILVRVMDKMARIASLLDDPTNDQVGESLRDSMIDAGNYLLIGVAFEDAERKVKQEKQAMQILDEIELDRAAADFLGHDCKTAGCKTAYVDASAMADVFDSSESQPEDADVVRRRIGPDPEDVEEVDADGFGNPCCPRDCTDCDADDGCFPNCAGCRG